MKKTQQDLAGELYKWERIKSIKVSCFTLYFDKRLSKYQIYQIAEYLEANTIRYTDVRLAVNFINYLSRRNIRIKRIRFRRLDGLDTLKDTFRVNWRVFRQWYIPAKFNYLSMQFRA